MKFNKQKLLFSLLFLLALGIGVQLKTEYVDYQYKFGLFNIEALSFAESSGGECYGKGSIDCPNSKDKVIYIY